MFSRRFCLSIPNFSRKIIGSSGPPTECSSKVIAIWDKFVVSDSILISLQKVTMLQKSVCGYDNPSILNIDP